MTAVQGVATGRISRSLAVEATVFWLVVISLAISANMAIGKTVIGVGELAPVVLYLVLAFFCWRRVRIAFLITPFLVFGGAVITLVFAYQNAPAETYAVAFHALAVFYSWRAYRELKAGA